MKKEGGLKLVLERNDFYRDKLKSASFILLLVMAINALMVIGIFYEVVTPVQPKYFAATGTGRILPTYSLASPVLPNSYVLQWTADKVLATYSIDYVHWREELQNASTAFTQPGWYYYNKALKASNTLKTVVEGKRISVAQITGAPKLLASSVVDGHFAWKIEMPLLVEYERPGEPAIRMTYEITVIVLRMPVEKYPDRLAINNILPNIQAG